MPAIKPLDPLGIESESDPLGIESQSDPLGIEQPSLARDILTANQSALELAGQANQMVNTGLAARDIMLDRPELEGPEFKNPEDIRKVPMRDTILGDRGKPVPFWNYDRSPEERRAQFVEGLTTSPISIPKLGIGPTWLEKAFAVANPATLPLAIATSPTEAAQMNRSAANAVSGLAEFAITPAGILTAPLAAGVLGKTVATLTKLGFSADMAKAAGEQAGSLVGEWDNLSQLERTDKLVGLGFTAALAASLAAHTAPEAARAIADRVESDGAVLARKLADEVKAANLPAPKSPEVQRRLGIRLTAEPFLQPGIPELADQALREAQSPIIRPDPAIEQLRRAVEPPQIVGAEPTRVAERIPGGGQAPYGKVSFMRGAEAPLPERTQAALSAEDAAIVQSVVDEAAASGVVLDQSKLPAGVSYRRPKPGPSQAEVERRQRRANVEAGLIDPSGYYVGSEPLPIARERQYPEFGPGEGVLSNLQRQRVLKALQRGDSPQVIRNILRMKEAPAETVAQETGVPVETVEKGIKIEAADHPEIAQSNPEVLPQIAKDELKLDKKVYDKEEAPKESELTKSGEVGKTGEVNKPNQAGFMVPPIVREMTSVAIEAASDLRRRVSNVRVAPYRQGQKFEEIIFELDGKPHRAELRGRNKDLMPGMSAEADKAIAVRAFLDGDAKPLTPPESSETGRGGGKTPPASSNENNARSGKTVAEVGTSGSGAGSGQVAGVGKEKPLNPGGSVSSLSPELQAKNAEAAAAQKKIAEELKKSLEKPAEPKPAESVASPSRVQVQNAGPQTFTVVERLKQTESEKALGEQPVRIRNEKTGKEEVVLESDLKEVSATAAAKPKGQTRVALDKALRDAGLDPSVFPDKASKKSALDRMIAKIEEAQAKIRGSRSTLRMGVPSAILDTALEAARLSLKAGKTLKEAIEAAIKHIRYNVKSFDEIQARAVLERELVGSKSVPRVEGEELKMRKSAERATQSEQFPEPVREQILKAPESKYKVQPEPMVEDVVSRMTDAELGAVTPESNIFVASQGELSKRLFDQGKYEEGYRVFQKSSEAGTTFGQNINQFKWIKNVTPFDVVKMVDKNLEAGGRDPLTKEQGMKLGKLANKSIEANKALQKAKNDWVNDPTEANAKLADEAKKASENADLEVQKLTAQYTPANWPRMLKAFVQGNPLTPISHVANTIGNVMGATMEAGSRGAGSFIDQVRTMLTGGERKLETSPVSGPVEAAKGFVRALPQSAAIIKRGSGDAVKGEFRQNLRPLRALQTAFAKNPDVPTSGGKIPFNERARLAVEGTFGVAPEVMLRLLSAADKPAYLAARARLINEQANLSKVPKQYRDMAQKFPELFFDAETTKRIEQEAQHAIFQNKSMGISYLESWIKNHGGDWMDLAFTMLVAPYRLTPWNLVGRTLIYNPLVAAARTAHYAAKGDIRQAELNSGRFIVGSLLYGAGYYLYANGLIGPSLDSKDETKKERLLSGEVLPPNHVNVSGLKRLAEGGNPKFQNGDETIDLTRGGGAAGAILSSVANIGRDFEKKPEGSSPFIASLLKNSTLEQASFTINQSFLKGVTGILDAIRDHNLEPYMNGVESMFLNLGTPNTLSALSRATRKYAPDLKDDSRWYKGMENLARERFGVLGLDDYLPLKRDLWGKPVKQTPEGRNALLYHLFDISKNRQVTSDPVALELYDLWRTTAKREVIPSIPERSITVENKDIPLTSKQYERYVELVGQKRRSNMDRLVVNPRFQDLSKEQKIKVIDLAYREGMKDGKIEFLKETPPSELQEAKKPKVGFQPIK